MSDSIFSSLTDFFSSHLITALFVLSDEEELVLIRPYTALYFVLNLTFAPISLPILTSVLLTPLFNSARFKVTLCPVLLVNNSTSTSVPAGISLSNCSYVCI